MKIEYTNTRHVPIRLGTSKGVLVLAGNSSLVIDEDVPAPYYVHKKEVVKKQKSAPKKASKKASKKAPKKQPKDTE